VKVDDKIIVNSK